MSFKHVNITS